MRYVIGAVVACTFAVLVLALLGFPADHYVRYDFFGFWAGGRILLEGHDPYDPQMGLDIHRRFGVSAPGGNEGLSPQGFGYPLPAAILALPFAALPISIAAPFWLVAQLALAGAALLAVARPLFGPAYRRDAPVLLAFVAASQSVWVLGVSGNIGGFLLAIAGFATALLLRGRHLAAGAVLGLLVVKPHPFLWFAPLLLLALRTGRLRVALGAALVGGGLLAISFAILPAWLAEWLAPVGALQASNRSRANVWGLVPSDARWEGWVLMGLVLVVFAIWWRVRRPPVAALVGGALAVSCFGAPYIWSYDQLVLAITVAAAIAAVARAEARVRATALVLLALAWVALPWFLYALAFSRGEESLNGLVPLALGAALVLLDRLARSEAEPSPRTMALSAARR